MDPQQRLVLELSWEALEDAGLPTGAVRGGPTGVFLGAIVAEHNPLAPRDQVLAQLDHHGARVVVAWQKSVELVTSDDGDLGGRTVFAVDLAAARLRDQRLQRRARIECCVGQVGCGQQVFQRRQFVLDGVVVAEVAQLATIVLAQFADQAAAPAHGARHRVY